VRQAAAAIPAEVSARFDTAAKLSDEDKKTMIEIARQALIPFQPKPEPKPEVKPNAKVEPLKEDQDEARPGSENNPKVGTKPKVASPPSVTPKPSAKVESKEKP
jgi:F-type H+-transporting ATPase subunit alpha